MPDGHYCIKAAWSHRPRALRKLVISHPIDIEGIGKKKIARQKIQLGPPRGKTRGNTSKYFQVRDVVPDGHYCIKAAWSHRPRALRKHIISHSIDFEGILEKKSHGKKKKIQASWPTEPEGQ